jgi:DNA-binding NarL/FixJ family response regulator
MNSMHGMEFSEQVAGQEEVFSPAQNHIAIVEGNGMYSLGMRQIIQQTEDFASSEVLIFKNLQEFLVSPGRVFSILILEPAALGSDQAYAAERILALNPGVAILLLMSKNDEPDLFKLLKPEILGVIPKDCDVYELRFALFRLVNGKSYVDSDWILQRHRVMVKKRGPAKPAPPDLDEKDIRMIRLIGEEYTQMEMQEIMELPSSTIMYLRRRVLAKLGVKNTAGLVRKAIQLGILD